MFKWFMMFLAVIAVCFVVLRILIATSPDEVDFPGQEMYDETREGKSK